MCLICTNFSIAVWCQNNGFKRKKKWERQIERVRKREIETGRAKRREFRGGNLFGNKDDGNVRSVTVCCVGKRHSEKCCWLLFSLLFVSFRLISFLIWIDLFPLSAKFNWIRIGSQFLAAEAYANAALFVLLKRILHAFEYLWANWIQPKCFYFAVFSGI